jgi:hypothetical protein
MKHLVQLSIAGSLALGSVAAHASITVPTSTNGNLGNVVLFADIFNSSGTLVAAYEGDTGNSVSSVGAGTVPTTTFEDANLATFLGEAAGNTVLWSVEGGNIDTNGNPFLVTSSPSLAKLVNASNGSVLTSMGTALESQIAHVNGYISASAVSYLGTNDSNNGGTDFNPGTVADISTWGGAVVPINSSGLGTKTTLYALAAAGQNGYNYSTITAEMNVSLTSSGLVFSSSGGTTVTPLPAAVWLLGSGLLGLAGVGRRKSKAA